MQYAYKSIAYYHGLSALTLTAGVAVMVNHDLLLLDQVITAPLLGGHITLIWSSLVAWCRHVVMPTILVLSFNMSGLVILSHMPFNMSTSGVALART